MLDGGTLRLRLAIIVLAALSGCIGNCDPPPKPVAPEGGRDDAAAVRDAAPDVRKDAFAETTADAAVLAEKGKMLYGRYCDFCHGAEGHGYAADEAPALANDDLLAIASDEYLRDAILKGRPGTTMSSWGIGRGGPVGADDASAIVVFLRGWQKRAPEKLEKRAVEGDATRGERLYGAQCAKCHGEKGTGGKYNALANPELLAAASDEFLAYTIEHGRSGTPMPTFAQLTKQDVDDLLSLLRTWQKAPVASLDLPPKPGELKRVVINPKGSEPSTFKEGADFIPVDVVKKEVDRGAALVIVDARAPGDYAIMHVAGAVSVPFYTVNDYAAQIPKDRWILTYCACPHAASVKARDALRALGYKKVAVLDEGINVWRDRGYPVRGGAKP
jgi:cytochrome c oxidase cbb3-type subunit 3/ubiquinol-cytochrome c reductase cytochrome c subunit